MININGIRHLDCCWVRAPDIWITLAELNTSITPTTEENRLLNPTTGYLSTTTDL